MGNLNDVIMANNRLYIVDAHTGEYLMLAKGWGCGWSLWDEKLSDFLETRYDDNDSESNLIIGHENDHEFYLKWLTNQENNFRNK